MARRMSYESVTGMTFDVATMLTIPVFRAMDVDSDGHVLAGTDESGSMQIIEISTDGDITASDRPSGRM